MGKLVLIADTSPKGGGNLQKEWQWHPMAAMREPQSTQPLAKCMQTWSCQEMPLHFYMVTITYVITSSKIRRHFLVETTAGDDFPFRSVSSFWNLSPILAWFSETWFEKRTCYPSNSWKSQVIRKAFPQQPPAFANEMVSNTTFPGWSKKTHWSLGIFAVPNWTNSDSLFKKTHANVEKILPEYTIRLMRLVGWSPKHIARKMPISMNMVARLIIDLESPWFWIDQ